MLNSGAEKIITQLNRRGYEAYAVGGAVRDFLLGRESLDFDITTSATPLEVRAVFTDYQIISTGERHGTLTVVVDDCNFEVTTFRIDKEYLDSRRPSFVEFSRDLKEDLARRDLTVNAIAYHPKLGIIDPFFGTEDLKNKIIRTVGDPDTRFSEDGLRILRAVRLSSVLAFEIEAETQKSIVKNKKLLANISAHRVYTELVKTLSGVNVKSALEKNYEILFEILPELEPMRNFQQNSLSHYEDVYLHTLEVVSNCENDSILRLSALFHDSGKPHSFQEGKTHRHFNKHWIESERLARSSLTRLKAPKKVVETVCAICLHHDQEFATKFEVKQILNKYGVDFFRLLLKHKRSDLYAHSEHGIKKYEYQYLNAKSYFESIIANGECYSLNQLKFKGVDAIKLSIKNEKIGMLLDRLLNLVMIGKLENNKIALIGYAERIKKYYKEVDYENSDC